MALSKIGTNSLEDLSVTSGKVANDGIGPTQLDETANYAFTGTVTGAGENNSPNFFVKQSGSQNIAFNTSTKLEFATELLDSDNAFASNTFTVPSGEGGKYFIFGSLAWVTANDFDHFSLNFKVNGSGLDGGSVNSNFNQNTVTKIYCITLSAGDTVDAYAYHNHSASALITYAERTNFGALKLTS